MLSVFGSVIVVFQSVFYLEKHVNNIFLFLKNYFWDQHIKMIWKHQKHINSNKKKHSNFMKNTFQTQFQTAPLYHAKKFNKKYQFIYKIIIIIYLMTKKYLQY